MNIFIVTIKKMDEPDSDMTIFGVFSTKSSAEKIVETLKSHDREINGRLLFGYNIVKENLVGEELFEERYWEATTVNKLKKVKDNNESV